MNVQGVKVSVGLLRVPTNWDQALDAWTAAVPPAQPPTYTVTVLAEDFGGLVTATIDLIATANGQAARITVLNSSSSPIPGALFRFSHAAPADDGVADFVMTAADGKTISFLDLGSYNLLVRIPGHQDVRITALTVAGPLIDFDGPGPRLETHSLKDNAGAAVVGARIIVRDLSITPIESSLAAIRTTGVAGEWEANLASATRFRFVEAAPGYDSVVAEVESIG